MVINNAINSPLPTSLALGGTNANLTPSNGGIFYSTATAGAILSGTPTGSQAILSGSSTSPIWSTATYPATTTINQLLYSSSDNVIGGLSTVNSASLILDETGIPVWSSPMTDGQVMIGGTNGRPIASTLSRGIGGVKITNSPGSITIDAEIPTWKWIATQTASGGQSLDFDNVFSSNYIAYHIVINNILPSSAGANLWLRFGINSTPDYISTDSYIFQQFCTTFNGTNNFYHGYVGGGFEQVYLTLTDIHGINESATYGGVCGYIDLFVPDGPYQVANGISRLSYQISGTPSILQYSNVVTSFQIPSEPFPLEDIFTSVQVLITDGYTIVSGSATLYGLTTLA
jgi:hypothetical protein